MNKTELVRSIIEIMQEKEEVNVIKRDRDQLKAAILDFLDLRTGPDNPFDAWGCADLSNRLAERKREVGTKALVSKAVIEQMYDTLKQAVIRRFAAKEPYVDMTTERLVDVLNNRRTSEEDFLGRRLHQVNEHLKVLQKEKDGLVMHTKADLLKIEALEKELNDLRQNPTNYMAGKLLELTNELKKLQVAASKLL